MAGKRQGTHAMNVKTRANTPESTGKEKKILIALAVIIAAALIGYGVYQLLYTTGAFKGCTGRLYYDRTHDKLEEVGEDEIVIVRFTDNKDKSDTKEYYYIGTFDAPEAFERVEFHQKKKEQNISEWMLYPNAGDGVTSVYVMGCDGTVKELFDSFILQSQDYDDEGRIKSENVFEGKTERGYAYKGYVKTFADTAYQDEYETYIPEKPSWRSASAWVECGDCCVAIVVSSNTAADDELADADTLIAYAVDMCSRVTAADDVE